MSSNDKKDQLEESIVFKTHCTTKPPPKLSCSLVAPVQIINKTVKHRSLPKFKFGDTDFNEDFKKSDLPFNSEPNGKLMNSEQKFVDMEDNSIIKVGPAQKLSNSQSACSFSPDIFSPPKQFYNQNNFPLKPAQSSHSNNPKPATSEFPITKQQQQPGDGTEYQYMNIHQQHTLPANLSNKSSFNSAVSPKEIPAQPPKSQDLFLNHSNQSICYSQPQSNMNHGKGTFFLLPNQLVMVCDLLIIDNR